MKWCAIRCKYEIVNFNCDKELRANNLEEDLPSSTVRGEWSSEVVFFFQAKDGIRGKHVTEVQTCALPICARR